MHFDLSSVVSAHDDEWNEWWTNDEPGSSVRHQGNLFGTSPTTGSFSTFLPRRQGEEDDELRLIYCTGHLSKWGSRQVVFYKCSFYEGDSRTSKHRMTRATSSASHHDIMYYVASIGPPAASLWLTWLSLVHCYEASTTTCTEELVTTCMERTIAVLRTHRWYVSWKIFIVLHYGLLQHACGHVDKKDTNDCLWLMHLLELPSEGVLQIAMSLKWG